MLRALCLILICSCTPVIAPPVPVETTCATGTIDVTSSFTFSSPDAKGESTATIYFSNGFEVEKQIEVIGVFENETPIDFVKVSSQKLTLPSVNCRGKKQSTGLILTANTKSLGIFHIQLKLLVHGELQKFDFSGFVTGPSLRIVPSDSLNVGILGLTPSGAMIARDSIVIENRGSENLEFQFEPAGDEVCFGRYLNQTCIPTGPESTLVPGGRRVVHFEVRPRTPGIRKWTLVVQSNDFLKPKQQIELTADVRRLSECNYTTNAPVPLTNTGGLFEIRNIGSTDCVFRDFELNAQWRSVFHIEGTNLGLVVPAHQTKVIPIVGTPMPSTPFNGHLTFSVSDVPGRGVAALFLRDDVSSQISINPSDVNFGTTSCPSPSKTFTVYNTFSQPIELASAKLMCFGPCDFVVSRPAPLGPLLPASTLSFGVQFVPSGNVSETQRGVYALEFKNAWGASITFLTELTGTALPKIVNSDTYRWGMGDDRRSTFYLTNTPDSPDEISVSIDGAPVPRVNVMTQMDQWIYNSAANSIRVNSNFLSGVSGYLTLEYVVGCSP
jgi:hypothetical protein